MTILYGIKNCDTVKKARTWLDTHKVTYQFHDLRTDGLTAAKVDYWLANLSPDVLINKRSTTWKELSDAERADLSPAAALQLILAHPTLIKRPLVEHNGQVSVGFKDADFAHTFL